MKTAQINLRTSPEDKKLLRKAAIKLQEETGKKPTTSNTIREAVKHLAENEPDLFFVDRITIREIGENVKKGQLRLQAVIDEFLKVAGKPVTVSELEVLYGKGRRDFGVVNKEQLREIVLSKLVEGKSSSIGGIQLSESMLKSLLIAPDLDPLFASADKLMDLPMVKFRDVFYWEVYLIQKGKVELNIEAVENLKNGFRCSAVNLEERKKLSKVRTLCETLTKFLEDKTLNPEKLNIQGVCHWDSESSRYEPSEQYIKFGL